MYYTIPTYPPKLITQTPTSSAHTFCEPIYTKHIIIIIIIIFKRL